MNFYENLRKLNSRIVTEPCRPGQSAATFTLCQEFFTLPSIFFDAAAA